MFKEELQLLYTIARALREERQYRRHALFEDAVFSLAFVFFIVSFCSALLPYRRRRFSRLLELGIIDVFSGAWMLELGAFSPHLRLEGHICRSASLAVEAFNPVGVTCL